MLHGLKRMCADLKAEAAAQNVADEGDPAQVRAELALRLIFGVAAELPRKRKLARQLALPGHLKKLLHCGSHPSVLGARSLIRRCDLAKFFGPRGEPAEHDGLVYRRWGNSVKSPCDAERR
ncbi:protein of unknown function [Candidatus Filomicrobium marinum]|uniref:Uncharacterized protein n=1 Tax=Candidatus Filomicrobium marinum TaxID=1608628 RepID=A0A0D6JC93_9HYPH|nr:protein of unknown function [Candidatus Filomicrobium marinum]CPR16340.1 protein of unknown function [Candidatus Filomicrobium marinum]